MEMKQKKTEAAKKRNLWMLENVDDATRRQIKQYAFENDITIAEALRQIVVLALERVKVPK
jgi:hypothetical protein